MKTYFLGVCIITVFIAKEGEHFVLPNIYHFKYLTSPKQGYSKFPINNKMK